MLSYPEFYFVRRTMPMFMHLVGPVFTPICGLIAFMGASSGGRGS